MRRYFIPFIIILLFIFPSVFFTSCGEDRSGEYYALISTKTWMYETMRQNYLFYEDLPDEGSLDFFKKPSDFLRSAVSSRDQKNGVIFSHIDSVKATRATSLYPTFGIEGALLRNDAGDNVVHILYTYPNSPASEKGLKRGDWILLADSQQISSSNFEQYITRPTQAYKYKIARKTADGKPDTLFINMPAPRIIKQPSVLGAHPITVGSEKAYYISYNSFENNAQDEAALKQVLNEIPASSHVILDLRYNPGGNVSTAVMLSTFLAPSEALNQICTQLIPNDKIKEQIVYTFNPELLEGYSQVNYKNLYIITTSNTASASELLINCLKPYLQGRLIQVGEPTFGKNVAQQLFTDPTVPELEFWLTTHYVSNCKGEYEYYEKGLQPDFLLQENLKGELGALGTEADSLMLPVLYHITNGTFPEKPETTPQSHSGNRTILRTTLSERTQKNQITSTLH